jgi:hypothetical protein
MQSWLATIARGSAVAPVREEAAAFTYVVSRAGRGTAAVSREAPDGTAVVLAGSARRVRGPDWRALAAAILLDATGSPPPAKLAGDLARFVVAPAGGERRLRADELVAWLGSWRPALAGLLGGR